MSVVLAEPGWLPSGWVWILPGTQGASEGPVIRFPLSLLIDSLLMSFLFASLLISSFFFGGLISSFFMGFPTILQRCSEKSAQEGHSVEMPSKLMSHQVPGGKVERVIAGGYCTPLIKGWLGYIGSSQIEMLKAVESPNRRRKFASSMVCLTELRTTLWGRWSSKAGSFKIWLRVETELSSCLISMLVIPSWYSHSILTMIDFGWL